MSATGGMHWTAALRCCWRRAPSPRGWPGVNTPTTSDRHRPRPAPSARSYPARAPLPTRDPELVAAETRNLLDAWRPSSTARRTVSCSADRAGSATPAAEDSRRRASSAGRPYKVTAACVGAPDAHLSVIQGAREGGTLLERSLDCGSVAGSAGGPGTRDCLGPPRPVWRRRPRARNRRRRRHPDQLQRAAGVSAGAPRRARAVGLWRTAPAGLESAYAHCSGVGRAPDPHGIRRGNPACAGCWRWPAAPTNMTTDLPAGPRPHPPRLSPTRRCRRTPP